MATTANNLDSKRMYPPRGSNGERSCEHDLDLRALVLVGRRTERGDRILQGILAGQKRSDVDTPGREIVDGPVELDTPAERAAKVELLHHQIIDDERQRF